MRINLFFAFFFSSDFSLLFSFIPSCFLETKHEISEIFIYGKRRSWKSNKVGTIPPATLIEMFPPKEKLGKGCPICEENK